MSLSLPRLSLVMRNASTAEEEELPLRILVLADLFQGPDPRPLIERHPAVLDRDSFASVLAAVAPRLACWVPHPRGPEAGASMRVSLVFKQLKDFTPEGLVQQVPAARSLLEVRQSLNALKAPLGSLPAFTRKLHRVREDEGSRARLRHELTLSPTTRDGTTADDTLIGALLAEAQVPPTLDGYDTIRRGLTVLLDAMLSPRFADQPINKALVNACVADLDEEISAWARALMHHPDFMRLQSTWRTLHTLVHRGDGRENIVLEVLHCPMEALREDFEDAAELRQSGLFQQLYEAVHATPGGAPYSLVVADFAFGASRDDLWLLARCGAVAAAMHCPFLADAAPDLLADDASATRWAHFRATAASQYVALCLPRVLLRLPYGESTVPVRSFNFAEVGDGAAGPFLWGSAAAAVAMMVAEGFAAHRWWHAQDIARAGRIAPLVREGYDGDTAAAVLPRTAQPWTVDDAHRLATRGLIVLAGSDDGATSLGAATTSAHVPVVPTCALPGSEGNPPTLWLLLCACRVVHCLRAVARPVPARDAEELSQTLSAWLDAYVYTVEDASQGMRACRPFLEATVAVEPHAQPPWRWRVQGLVRLQRAPDGADVSLPFSFGLGGYPCRRTARAAGPYSTTSTVSGWRTR